MEQPFIHHLTKHQSIIHKVCRIYRDTPEDREDLFQEIVYQLEVIPFVSSAVIGSDLAIPNCLEYGPGEVP